MLCLVAFSVIAMTSQQGEQPQWIAPGDTKGVGPLLRREFELAYKPVSAKVKIVGLGQYELRLNGERVGKGVLNQAWSEYNRTLYVQEFDITQGLSKGRNVIGVSLANSWWHVGEANDPNRYTKTDAMPDFSEGQPFLLWLDASLTFAGGQTLHLGSNSMWVWHPGPYTFSNIYAGEDYDARLLPVGWDRPGFGSAWSPVKLAKPPTGKLVPLVCPPMLTERPVRPTEVRHPSPGVTSFIFPRNIAAVLRFTVQGTAGQTVRFKDCEYLAPDGRIKFTYLWGTGKDLWQDYTLRGGGKETYESPFFYVGGQYVEVTGAVAPGQPNPNGLPVIHNLELVPVRLANPEVGSFTTDSDIQNRAHVLIDTAIRSNMSWVATDCPHREKNGWQEENWHMARAISYRYDDHDWLRKIAHDLRDTQLPDGHIPTNVPNYLVGVPPHGFWNEAPEWGIAGVLVPWHLYEWYGDKNALADSFDSMRRYVDYLGTTAENGLIKSNLGDWYDYGHGKGDGPSQWTPSEVSATAIWALGTRTVAQAAHILRHESEAQVYEKRYEMIRKDFLERLYNATTHQVKNNGSCQSGNAIALMAGLLPDADRAAAVNEIVKDVVARGYQQTCGEVLQVAVIRALAENGHGDVLHKIFAREDRGGYGFMVKSGLTSLPESWDAKPGTGNSLNHFMLGHLVEWHFAYVAGIQQASGSVGWKDVVIAPNPGPLGMFSASFMSPRGLIKSSWKRGSPWLVAVPAGMHAVAVFSDGTRTELKSGTTKLTWR